jgi:hypothetical protein
MAFAGKSKIAVKACRSLLPDSDFTLCGLRWFE